MKKAIIFLFIMLFLQSCMIKSEYKKPVIALPSDNISKKILNEDYLLQNIKDKNLIYLIKIAVKNNDDIRLAAARVDEAAAYLGLEHANRFPIVSGDATISRFQTSKEASIYRKAVFQNDFIISSSVSYDFDFWGKYKNQEEAARAALLSEKYNQLIVRLSVISDVAINYIKLVSSKQLLELYKETLKDLKDIFNFRKKQYKNGLIDKLVLNQAKAQYETVAVLIEKIKSNIEILKSTLSILIGETPEKLFKNNLKVSDSFPVNINIPQFIPSKVLENRPDIKKAEEDLKEANFNVAVAKAYFFPDISITGLLGLESLQLRNLIDINAKKWSIGGNLTDTIFDFGRRNANVNVAKAQVKEALINYVKVVKRAFKEVFDSLKAIDYTKKRLKISNDRLVTLKNVLELAIKKFNIGNTDYLEVLTAREKYLSAESDIINLEAELLINKVLFYKALGLI